MSLKDPWSKRLRYKGIVIQDPDYHIWGSSLIWGNDGRVHVFSSRIPIVTGFDKWWAPSQIAHYVSDKPEGPFLLVGAAQAGAIAYKYPGTAGPNIIRPISKTHMCLFMKICSTCW